MTSRSDIDRRFRRFRIQEVATKTVVYAIFYVCRLAFSAAKKDMIELGAYTTDEISDRFFKGGRNGMVLSFGLLNVASLVLFMLVPGQHLWIDVLAMSMFGIAMGILLCFLGGLMAVDLVPRNAAGAAMGIVAVLTYVGAAVQSRVSALFIETSKTGGKLASKFVTTTVFGHEVDAIAIFWIGMAVLSVLCALSVWKAKPQN